MKTRKVGRPKSTKLKQSEAMKRAWAKRKAKSAEATSNVVGIESLNDKKVTIKTNVTVAIDENNKVYLLAS